MQFLQIKCHIMQHNKFAILLLNYLLWNVINICKDIENFNNSHKLSFITDGVRLSHYLIASREVSMPVTL